MEEIVEILESEDPNQPTNQDFRLWITSEPCNKFPLNLL